MLVQGAGGNTSLKRDGTLWIKASGTWLAEAAFRSIFLALDLGKLQKRLRSSDVHSAVGDDASGGLRPSIETPLHVLMPQSVVLHVHSVNAIAWAVRLDGRSQMRTLLSGLPWAWVPYRRPGHRLTRAVEEVISGMRSPPSILVLQNHGLLVAGDDCDSAEKLLTEVDSRFALSERAVGGHDRTCLEAWCGAGVWRLPTEAVVHSIATDARALEITRQGVLYPDHAVFLGPVLPEARAGETPETAATRFGQQFGSPPQYLVVPDRGVVVHREIPDGSEAMLGCLSRVARRLPPSIPLRFLDDGEVAELLSWDAERFRKALDATPSRR